MNEKDVVVVGAGPSGAIAAYELARAGASVLLLDRADFPRWKVCGACLSPGAISVLTDAGLADLPERLGAVCLERLVVHAGGREALVRLGGSAALSRTAFDAALVGAAVEVGADFRPRSRATLGPACLGHRLVRVVSDDGECTVRAGVVLDATGLGGSLGGDMEGASAGVAPRSRIGLGAVFYEDAYPVAPGTVHMAVGRDGYVGLVRVEDGSLNVAAALDPTSLRGTRPGVAAASVLREAGLPELPGTPSCGWRGTPLLTRRSSTPGGHRWLRVGDAAGYVEPFTGEGICWALSAGRAAAGMVAGRLGERERRLVDSWSGYLDNAAAPSRRLCRLLARALRRPRIVSVGVAALAFAPWLAEPLVRRAGTPPALVSTVGGRIPTEFTA